MIEKKIVANRIERYGANFPLNATDADIELMCFHRRWPEYRGGLGRYGHLKRAIDLLWNEPRRSRYRYGQDRRSSYDPDRHDAFIWNEWTEDMMRAYCDFKEVTVAGPGASWKTTAGALFFLCLWLSSPANTRIIITSTTGDGLRARVWKEVVHFYRTIANIGNLVQSRTMIQTIKGDDGAGIFGIAVEADGDVDKAVNKIIGRHNTNMAIFVDEMPTVNDAIVESRENLETGAETFQFGGVGNPDSHFDPHGKMSEPKEGWESITDLSTSWFTRGGICIHLDGRRSPRNGNPEKFPGLIWQDDLDRTAARYGEDSPQMWKQRYGFWAPEGLSKTVVSESDIVKFRARDKVFDGGGWENGFTNGAGLDPAFEGEDRRVLQFFKYGTMSGGLRVLELGERVLLNIKVRELVDNPLHYQIQEQTKRLCVEKGVSPEWFGLDSTGEGGGLASIFIKEWSPKIRQIEFGGRASDKPISSVRVAGKEKPKLGYEEYINAVSELWYRFRLVLRAGQIRGLDNAAAQEFCKRFYILRGNYIMVEPKKDMKLRTGGKSCDLADADVVCLAVVVENVPDFIGELIQTPAANDNWKQLLQDYNVNEDLILDMSV